MRQHIGLGEARAISNLELTWPTSKTVQHFQNVPMDAFYGAKEGAPQLFPLTYKSFALHHGESHQGHDVQPAQKP